MTNVLIKARHVYKDMGILSGSDTTLFAQSSEVDFHGRMWVLKTRVLVGRHQGVVKNSDRYQ